jgi:hypothetical protein
VGNQRRFTAEHKGAEKSMKDKPLSNKEYEKIKLCGITFHEYITNTHEFRAILMVTCVAVFLEIEIQVFQHLEAVFEYSAALAAGVSSVLRDSRPKPVFRDFLKLCDSVFSVFLKTLRTCDLWVANLVPVVIPSSATSTALRSSRC